METTKIVSPYLRLRDPLIEDDSITEFEYVEYLPDNPRALNEIEQKIETKDLNEYLLPHKAQLEVRGRLLRNDNNHYTANEVITLVNNGWALFESLQYLIDGNIVEDIHQHLSKASTILNLVQFSDDYGRSTATNMFWYRDTGVGAADISEYSAGAGAVLLPTVTVGDGANPTGAQFRAIDFNNLLKNLNYNLGFRQRQALTNGGGERTISMFLPLSSILASHKDINNIFTGVRHTYKLRRSTPEKYIHKVAAADNGRFVLDHLSIWMPKVKPSLAVRADLEAMLISGFTRSLYFEQVKIYERLFNATELNPTWRVSTSSSEQTPRHLFIAFASVERELNALHSNQVFDNAKLRRISARINSKQYPDREIECNFAPEHRNYSRAYMMFQEAVHKYAETDSGSQVSINDFESLYPIFHIDLSKSEDKLKIGPFDLGLSWQLASNFRNIANTGDSPYRVFCVVLSDRYIKMEALHERMRFIV